MEPEWPRHLASHILGRMAKPTFTQDWRKRIYARILFYWLETFVDTSRFRSTMLSAAANWNVIGTTRSEGRGHRAPTFEPTRPVKQMLGLSLHRKFRELLCA